MRTAMTVAGGALCVACATACPGAAAHVVLETRSATAGSTYKAVLRVGHGCDGRATTAIEVEIPEGVIGAKPQPKPGWTIATRSAPVVPPVNSHGRPVDERVVSIVWTGGPLPDAHYDEFVAQAVLPSLPSGTPSKMLWWKVVQRCGDAISNWTAIPDESTPRPPRPAPGLELLPASAAHRH